MLEGEYKMKHQGGSGHFNLGSQGRFCRWGSTYGSLKEEIGIHLLDQEPEEQRSQRNWNLKHVVYLRNCQVQGGERWVVDKAGGLGKAGSWRALFVLSRNWIVSFSHWGSIEQWDIILSYLNFRLISLYKQPLWKMAGERKREKLGSYFLWFRFWTPERR